MDPHQTTNSTDMNQQEQIRKMEKTIQRLIVSRKLVQEFVGNIHGVKNLVALVLERVLEALDAEAGSLWLVNKHKKQNICHLSEGPGKEQVIGVRLPFGAGVVGAVIESQKSELVLDCSSDSRFNKSVDKKTGFVTHSMICVPLIVDGESYGAITIVNKKSSSNHHFDEYDCELVEELAVGASLSVKNARLLEMESRVNEMNILMTISKEVVATLDIEQVLNFVVNKSNELVDISTGAIALWEDSKNAMALRVLSDGKSIDNEDSRQVELLNLMDKIRASDRSSYVADRNVYKKSLSNKNNDWLNYLEKYQLEGFWAVPLKDDQGALGVLWFESEVIHFASHGKTDLLHILASQASVALRNASLFKSIPFSTTLSNIGQKSKSIMATSSKKIITLIALLTLVMATLHYAPYFRWASGITIVEARLGVGAFLPVEGRVVDVLVQEGQKVKAGEIIATLDNIPSQISLLEAESQLAILERQVIEARSISDTALMGRIAIEKQAVRAQVQKAKADLDQVTIRAPIDGIVLTPRPTELTGRFFGLGEEIMRFYDPENLLAIVHITETDLVDIQIGQEVKGVLRYQPGEYFEGIVRHVGRAYEIPNTALDASTELESEEINTGFVVEVEVLEAPYQLRPGMTGQAIIYTPETSALTKIWRRLRSFLAFNFGL